MRESPYDKAAPSSRTEQTTIWRDGQVVRTDAWGRVRVWPDLPTDKPHPVAVVTAKNSWRKL